MFLRARQFLPPQGGDAVAHLLRRGVGQAFEGLVAEVGHENVAQREGDVDDDLAAAAVLLEARGAVAETAFVARVAAVLAGAQVDGLHLDHRVLGFGPVGAHVLHHGGAHRARYGAEVLEAVEAAVEGPLHEVVHPRAGPHRHAAAVGHRGAQLRLQGQHEAVKVAREHHVAAGADDEPRVAAQQGRKVEVVAVLYHHQPASLGGDAECIESLQRSVTVNLHVYNNVAPTFLLCRRQQK